MSAISPLTWKSPISGRAKIITGIAMIVETKTPKTTDCFSTSSALSRSLAPMYRATNATVPVPTAAIPARTAPRICVASPTAPTASAPSRPTISIEDRPRIESRPNDRITGHASAHTSKRMRSIGGRVIATRPCPPTSTSGTASRNSDMIVISYASTRHGSQWTLRGARTDSMKIARAKSAISRAVGGQQNPDGGRASPRPLAIFAAIFVASGFIYSFHLGTDALGASEAFSAWSAAKPGIGAIARTPILHEPGRFLFYYAALHYYTQIFGLSEISLRSMSVVLSLATLVLVFELGCEMFDDNTALAAAAMWAFNPLAVAFAHTARMYPMILTLALAQLLMLWRIRRRPGVSIATVCGIAGAALLYTHMGGVLFIGAGLAMLVRDSIRGQRNPMAWLAMAITLALFVPYAPVLRAQSETMISGHWLDWIGTAYEYPLWIKIAAALGAAAVAAWFVFGASPKWDRDDTFRWLGAWTIIPGLALAAGSIAVHPMFNLRYVAPSLTTFALLIAAGIAW